LPEDAARRYSTLDRDHRAIGVEEEDVKGEAHAEGVDAGAARDQQAGAGVAASAKGKAPQPGSEILCNGDGGMKMVHAPIRDLARDPSPAA